MTQMLRKMMYFGFGALTMTAEKAEKFFNEMVEKGEMSREEAKGFIDEAIKKGQEQKEEIRKMVQNEFESLKGQLSFVSRSEIAELENRILQLENKVAILEMKINEK